MPKSHNSNISKTVSPIKLKFQGSYGQGKSAKVREFWGSQRKSGKTEGQGEAREF